MTRRLPIASASMRMRPTGLWARSSAAAQMWAPPNTRAKTPNSAKLTAARPAAKLTDASSGASSSASAPAASSSIATPMTAASAPHRLARIPSKETCRSIAEFAGGPTGTPLRTGGYALMDEDVELDAGGRVVARGHRKAEPGPIGDAGRDRDVHLVVEHFSSSPGAADAELGPGLATPAALAAHAA